MTPPKYVPAGYCTFGFTAVGPWIRTFDFCLFIKAVFVHTDAAQTIF